MMSKKEFATIAIGIKAAYPQSEVIPDNASLDFWYMMLGDIDYTVLQNAVLEHISTSPFVPRISELREKCSQRLTPIMDDWGEAWEEVLRAIRKFGSYREEEALASLSHLTAVAVRRMGFQNLCQSENPVADRAHFQRMYEGMVKEEKRQTQLPEFVREERERLIESNTPPVLQIENKQDKPQSDSERASPEYVENLMKELRRSMIPRYGKS